MAFRSGDFPLSYGAGCASPECPLGSRAQPRALRHSRQRFFPQSPITRADRRHLVFVTDSGNCLVQRGRNLQRIPTVSTRPSLSLGTASSLNSSHACCSPRCWRTREFSAAFIASSTCHTGRDPHPNSGDSSEDLPARFHEPTGIRSLRRVSLQRYRRSGDARRLPLRHLAKITSILNALDAARAPTTWRVRPGCTRCTAIEPASGPSQSPGTGE